MPELSAAFAPSPVRRGLDELLARHPGFDLVAIDWQLNREEGRWADHREPRVLVELVQPSDAWTEIPAWAVWRFAIWKATGAVYNLDASGAIQKQPLIELAP